MRAKAHLMDDPEQRAVLAKPHANSRDGGHVVPAVNSALCILPFSRFSISGVPALRYCDWVKQMFAQERQAYARAGE